MFLTTNGSNLASMYGISVNSSDPLVLTLYGQALQMQYESVLSEVFYETTADEPGSSSRTIEFFISDGEFNTTATTSVNILPVNDPAFFNFQNRTINFNESTRDLVLLFLSEDTLTDSDGNTLEWVSLEIVSPIDAYDDLMVDVGTTGLIVDYRSPSEGESLLLNISGRANNTVYIGVLQTVAFSNVFPGLDLTSREVEVITYDGETESPSHDITIDILPFDDPPMCFFGEWVSMPSHTTPITLCECILL